MHKKKHIAFAIAAALFVAGAAAAETPNRSYRLIDAQGERALVAGPGGIGLIDARTGEEIAYQPGRFTDVALRNGGRYPVALQIFPGNPATVKATIFNVVLSPYDYKESINPPYGGRIAGTSADRWYWQAGRKAWFTERYETPSGAGNIQLWRSVDPATVDIAASTDGFATIAGDTVTYYGADGNERWTNDLDVSLTKVIAGESRVVVLGALQFARQGNYIPAYIIDVATGDLIVTVGSSGLVSAAALHAGKLYLGRPVGVTGAIDVYDVSSYITTEGSIALPKPPLGIGVTDHGIIWVNGSAYWLPPL